MATGDAVEPVRPLSASGTGDTPPKDLGLSYAQTLKIWIKRFQTAQETIRQMDRDFERLEKTMQTHIDVLVRENEKLVRENESLKRGLPAEDGSTGE